MSSKFSRLASKTEDSGLESAGARKRWIGCSAVRDVLHVPLDRISPDPDQPRKEFDEEALFGLAGSLKAKGQLQPVRVRYDEEGDHYFLIAGERRWRAAAIAKLDSLQCIVDNHDDDQRLTQVVENLQRSDLSPMEQARAFDKMLHDNSWTQSQLAESTAVSLAVVSRSLAMLDLSPADQAKVDAGELRGAALRKQLCKKPRKAATKSLKFTAAGLTVTVTSRKAITKSDALRALAEIVAEETPKARKAA
jgi:ParB/RepB/Spo0J family partition protein